MKVLLNPISKDFSLKLRELRANARYEVYDMAGKLLQIGSISRTQQRINIDTQMDGLYLLKVYNGKDVYNERIIKQF